MDLDLSDAFDSDILDTFTVTRRPQVMSATGRASVPDPETIDDVAGVVCFASAKDLERLPEDQRLGKVISVVSQFQFRSASQDGDGNQFQPDLISWQGNDFVVLQIQPYTHAGSGFSQALASSQDSIDRAPGT